MESKKPLTDLVYNKIYEEIISGELQAGDIITEKQIITRYGISRSPVREALISLCGENILCSIPRAGYQVVSFSHAEVKQLTEARLLLECYLLEKGFPSLTEEKLQQLSDFNSNSPQNTGANGYIETWYDNIGFHLLLASFAENKYLSTMLRNLLRFCTNASTHYYSNPEAKNYEPGLHIKIIEACQKRDLDEAKRILSQDIEQLLII